MVVVIVVGEEVRLVCGVILFGCLLVGYLNYGRG